MTSKLKKIKNSQRQSTRKQSSKKQTIKIPTYEALGLGDDLNSVTSQEKGIFKNNKHRFSINTKISRGSQKNPKKRSKDNIITSLMRNCFKPHKKTESSLTKNLKKSILPISSEQKTKKTKDSLNTKLKKTSLKKPSKYKSGNSNSILSIIG